MSYASLCFRATSSIHSGEFGYFSCTLTFAFFPAFFDISSPKPAPCEYLLRVKRIRCKNGCDLGAVQHWPSQRARCSLIDNSVALLTWGLRLIPPHPNRRRIPAVTLQGGNGEGHTMGWCRRKPRMSRRTRTPGCLGKSRGEFNRPDSLNEKCGGITNAAEPYAHDRVDTPLGTRNSETENLACTLVHQREATCAVESARPPTGRLCITSGCVEFRTDPQACIRHTRPWHKLLRRCSPVLHGCHGDAASSSSPSLGSSPTAPLSV